MDDVRDDVIDEASARYEGMSLLHDRDYRVRAYPASDDEMVLHGTVKDVIPPGVLIGGDTEPILVHHMDVELRVAHPGLEITAVHVRLEVHPMPTCPTIAEHYEQLVGLSVARGFTHNVRELFGGPRGCSHTTALLQAMAPIAVQARYAMTRRDLDPHEDPFQDLRRVDQMRNIGSCHVWAEGSGLAEKLHRGEPVPVPLPLIRRYEELGRELPDDYF
jgi:hypothetical protein